MLTFVGLLIILTIVVLLIWGKASPIVAMVMVPLIGALIAGFGINDIQTFFEQGLSKFCQWRPCLSSPFYFLAFYKIQGSLNL